MVKKVKEVVKKVKASKAEKPVSPSSVKKSNPLRVVSPEIAFYVIDGNKLHSLLELADALEMMSDDSFFYHVNESKNDFAHWTRDVFQEEDLAERLFRAKTAQRMQVMVLRHILNKLI